MRITLYTAFIFCIPILNGCFHYRAEVPLIDPTTIYSPTEEGKPDTPYHIYVYGLNSKEMSIIKSSDKVLKIEPMENGRTHISFKPNYRYNSILDTYQIDYWSKGPNIDKALFHIKKKKIGNSEFYDFGGICPPAWSVVNTRGAIGYTFNYSSGRLHIAGMNQATPKQLFHDMELWFHPETIELRKAGNYYALFSNGGTTYWPINNQMYIIIDSSEFNEDLVIAYSDRLGNILPADYKFDYDQWVIDDIRWKMKYWDEDTRSSIETWFLTGGTIWYVNDMTYFMGYRGKGPSGIEDKFRNCKSMIEAWNLQYRFRCWLWSNAVAHNFKKQENGGYHVLKGPSKFDFDNDELIDLPPDIKGPPCPTPDDVERIKQQTEDLHRRQYQYLVENSKRDGVELIHTENCNCATSSSCEHPKHRGDIVNKYKEIGIDADPKYFTSFQFEVLKEGIGPSPSITDYVEVAFDGMYIERDFMINKYHKNTLVFATSRNNNEPSLWSIKRGEREVCGGLTDALLKMKVGGKYRVMLPVTLKHDYDWHWDGSGASLFHTVTYEIELLGIVDKATAEARYAYSSKRFNLDEYFKEYEDTKEKPEGVSK